MLTLEKSTIKHIDYEEEIINSNTYYNLIVNGKEKLSSEEILEEIQQSEEIGAFRYLLKDGMEYVGIIEYLMTNPKDQFTWLGLLMIKQGNQSKGYGTKALDLFYEIMKRQEINKFRIGVIAENEPAHRFWKRHGFIEVNRKTRNDNKCIVIYEKILEPEKSIT